MAFPVVIITDCKDDNAKMRQMSRVAALMPGAASIAFCGVNNALEAGGNIVDALDAFDGLPGVILANVAPRSGKDSKIWENGPPFGHLKIKKSLVFGTIGDHTFSLLQKIVGRNLKIDVFRIAGVVDFLNINKQAAKRVIDTQFRSFEFMPRAAAKLMQGIRIPTHSFRGVPAAPNAVWWVDNFGNLKTTLLPKEAGFRLGRKLIVKTNTRPREITCSRGLSEAPDGELGIVIGSSGYGDSRFLEIVLQGGSASRELGLMSGDEVTLSA